ncbi:MAG: triphosphoribosyl-dephospho-CoA synthase [Prevotella sp.]|nr:triphosphoribosyl-dephospho-CoA synthase [Prevotella sp.]MCM1075081.1 triphosphoribosyl-dephospho-CoA synthase [Ruminococcus sp.]
MNTFEGYEIREIMLGIGRLRREWLNLLSENDLVPEQEPDFTLGVFDIEDKLQATASLCGDVIKFVATSEAVRGQAVLNQLISRLRSEAYERGISNLFIYTKPIYVPTFESLGFNLIGMAGLAAQLESDRHGLERYKAYLNTLPRGKHNGVIIMNANPATKGHLSLIERAAAEVDCLTVIPLSDNPHTLFPAEERIESLRLATASMSNVTIADPSPYCISATTFPSYFIKSVEMCTETHIQLDINIFGKHIAPSLEAEIRFVGTEPTDELTSLYNVWMERLLEGYEIVYKEFPRLNDAENIPVSASNVRRLLESGSLSKAVEMVPLASLPMLLAHSACLALHTELNLTPKPGLVDQSNCGAHKDMDYNLMSRSIDALRPYFYQLSRASLLNDEVNAAVLQPIGLQAEKAMFEATGNINTHRGALFSLGLCICAATKLIANNSLSEDTLITTISKIANTFPTVAGSHGAAVSAKYHIPTALEAAKKGYSKLVRQHRHEPDLYRRLLLIMSQLHDSNIYYRGGEEAAGYVREAAGNMLNRKIDQVGLAEFDRDLTARNLSPGGAADMLALSIFVNNLLNNHH